jgi:hypothetical protein
MGTVRIVSDFDAPIVTSPSAANKEMRAFSYGLGRSRSTPSWPRRWAATWPAGPLATSTRYPSQPLTAPIVSTHLSALRS